MKKKLLVPIVLLCACAVATTVYCAEEEAEHPASIHVTGKPTKAERAKLAKVSFEDALKTAEAAQAGAVVSGVLEAEDGGLQYAFEILNPQTGKIDEVAVDAGNGKVLGIDRDDKD